MDTYLGLGVSYLVYLKYFWLSRLHGQSGHSVHLQNFNFQEPCVLKTAGRRVKWTKIWAPGVGTSYIYTGYFWLVSVQDESEVIWCISEIFNFQQPCILKTAGRIAKRSEIWDSGKIVTHIWSTFDLVVFKVFLGSFGALVSKWPIAPKSLIVERNGLKFGLQGH